MADEKRTTSKKKNGRKSLYRPEYADLARKCCAILGATNAQLGEFFNVTERTINNWIAREPAFRAVILPAREQADGNVKQSLYRRAVGYSHPSEKIFYDSKAGQLVRATFVEHYPPDTTAQIFWLKNRDPANWRDQRPEGGSGSDEERAANIKGALDQMLASVAGPSKK